MTKRPASERLEASTHSPASKKARILAPPPPPPPPPAESKKNGHPATGQLLNGNGAGKQPAAHEEALSDDGEDEDEDDAPGSNATKSTASSDLYLDTISRGHLDFDFEKLCSVTLSNVNVYACLVCGKYYSGRGPKTQAYFHSLDEDHHVYINMETKKVYVLPEGYEVKSKNLDDIRIVVDPRFTPKDVKAFDKAAPTPSWDLLGRKYFPGFVGLNNIKANDYMNVVIQILAHVTPLRNFLMLEDLSSKPKLLKRFSLLVRKLWNGRNFKSHVSPHELSQSISVLSAKEYTVAEQSDPAEFLAWFLDNLHLSLGGTDTKPDSENEPGSETNSGGGTKPGSVIKTKSSLIQGIFQGTMKIESQAITTRAGMGDRLRFEDSAEVKSEKKPFTILTLDLPPAPLFHSDRKKDIIPQVPLPELLRKYSGLTSQERSNTRMRHRLLHPLPPYLIMHVQRFESRKFLESQRNPTIVTFNTRSLDMSPYVEPNPALHPLSEPVVYDLCASVSYEGVKVREDSVEGEAERKVWKAQMREGGGTGAWWEVQDMFVEKVEAEFLSAKEMYVMVWERRRTVKGGGKGR